MGPNKTLRGEFKCHNLEIPARFMALLVRETAGFEKHGRKFESFVDRTSFMTLELALKNDLFLFEMMQICCGAGGDRLRSGVRSSKVPRKTMIFYLQYVDSAL